MDSRILETGILMLSHSQQKIIPVSSGLVCGTCRVCCQGEVLILHPEMGDNPAQYLCRTIKNPLTGKLVFSLAQKENGDCVYLGENGCTNYENRPAICREFDCRRFYLKAKNGNKLFRLASDFSGGEVMQAGRERLHTLET